MPFWKDFVHTKGDVDDDDLPLPEHRIYDDDGHVKEIVEQAVAAAWRQSTGSHSATANAKKSPPLSPKRRSDLLKSVGAKATSPLVVSELKAAAQARSPAASRSPSVRKSAAQSPAARPASAASTPRRGSATPTKAAAKKGKAAAPSKSPARGRARSPAPAKPKAAAKKAAKASRSRSRSKSGSRKGGAAASKTPSPKWTLAALKEFAKDNAIALGNASKKAEVLEAIKKSS